MSRKSLLILLLLMVTTVIGISLALFGQGRWMQSVFWYSSQALPFVYVALAWWCSGVQDDPALDSEPLDTSSLPESRIG